MPSDAKGGGNDATLDANFELFLRQCGYGVSANDAFGYKIKRLSATFAMTLRGGGGGD